MDKNVRPSYFKKWEKLFHEWDLWLEEEGLSSLEACLSFALYTKNVDKILIGIDSLKQLKEIVEKFKTKKNPTTL